MHVLLYVPDNQVTNNFIPHLWPFLLQRLTPDEHRVSIIDGNAQAYNSSQLVEFIRRAKIELVGMGFMTRMAQSAYRMASAIRAATGVPVVMGGPHVTEVPEEPLGLTGLPRCADAVVRGEADDLWTAILQDAARKQLKERYEPPVVNGRDVKPTLKNYPIIPWDELDLQLFNLMRFVPERIRRMLKKLGVNYDALYVIPMESGRGCPYGCDFCTVTGFFGDQIRFRDNDNVIGELLRLKRLARKDNALIVVLFIDDNLAVDRKRTQSLLRDMIAHDVRPPWWAQISMNLLRDQELIELMSAGGCRWVCIGLESLSPESLQSANKGFNKPAEYGQILNQLARHNIYGMTSFILGMEADRPGVARETVQAMDAWPPGLPVFSILTSYPGTPLYERLRSEGRLVRDAVALVETARVQWREELTLKVLRFIFVMFFFAGLAWAQSHVASSEIGGKIADPTGAALSGALVTVSNTRTGLNRVLVTGQSGEYRALLLPPGVYSVKAEAEGFVPQLKKEIQITVGQVGVVDFQLEIGSVSVAVEVVAYLPLLEPERTQQSNTIDEVYIRRLPIDRRDYLSYTLLVPGVADSDALADASDFRVPQTRHSGLSFYGSNGRGNSITVDGGEANTGGGGVRPNLSQEAVQEFQINRGNYSAELGSASGGVVNIVSKSGTNVFRGSAYAFIRHQSLDAADPFARIFAGGETRRIEPPSERRQFGATFGGPIAAERTLFFAAFEGLERNESNSVPILTDPAIFEPTPEQEAILGRLPQQQAAALRRALVSSPATRAIFDSNNGVFPFTSSDYKFSVRVDHRDGGSNQWLFRYNYTNSEETNPNTRALVGISRGYEFDQLVSTKLASWTHTINPRLVNEARFQFNYTNNFVSTNDKFGPEININGFGFFNRDFTLPSKNYTRFYQMTEMLSADISSHLIKVGGEVLVRSIRSESHAFFAGRFNFGPLPGGLVSPALASTSITALQAFDLGLPQLYQQGFGDPTVFSTDPYFAVYIQDRWKSTPNFTLDLGLRYELDDRRDPVPTDKNNLSPRVAFAWDPFSDHQTTIRGGYGIFYSPAFYFVDWVANALNEINGRRQIAQVLTTIQTQGPAGAANIYRTLLKQGVVRLPSPSRSITPADLKQFGIEIRHDGPLPPLSVLFRNAEDFVNAYSQQGSLGIERLVTPDLLVSFNYLFARTLKIVRARDANLLDAPVDPRLGIRVWRDPRFFKRPLLLQDNVYESSARAFYHGLTVEMRRRFSNHFSLNFNYTLSKAMDEVVDFNSDFQANDQLNLQAERALSSFDQRHKLVIFSIIEAADFTLVPVVRANSARPFNLLAGFDLNQDRHPTTDRPVLAGRNTGIGPNFWTVDLRLARKINFSEHRNLELMAEAFNLFNRLNYRSVNNTVGNRAGPFNLEGRKDLNPSQPLAFTSAFEPRRIQLGVRLNF